MACAALVLPGMAYGQLTIHTFAGNGTAAYTGDGGAATAATLNDPYGVAVDVIGNVYIADYGNNTIRKVDTFGIIHTIAGTGTAGFYGDYGPATAALLDHPRGIAVDPSGNVYFSDYANLRIRKISTSGMITTVVGNGLASFTGDGGPAASATINYAWGLAFDAAGNLYIADQMNCRVRKVNTSGNISTIAGTGSCFISGDGGPASAARLQYPYGVACDGSGNIFIADNGNNRIRKIDAAGTIHTIAGSVTYGFSGDGGPSTAAKLNLPTAVATDPAGDVYLSDINNSRIREINTSGVINSIIGNGTDGFSGDGGVPYLAEINRSTGVAIGPGGKIYVCDNNNNRIRVVYAPGHAPYFVLGHAVYDTACPTETISVDSLLTIYDADTGQTETWSLISGPVHGTVTAPYSTMSTGSTITPMGIGYSPGTYVGTDSFKIRITDGGLSDTTTVHITILPPPDPGTIAGVDSLCPGGKYIFTDTSAGGTWGSSSTSTASVTTGGQVTGLAPGTVTITYAVTNACGTATASFVLLVSAHCHTGIAPLQTAEGAISIYPDPGNGAATINISGETGEVHFVITDMLGHVVKTFTAEAGAPMPVQLDAAGMYICSAVTQHGNYVAKMTVIK